MQVSSTVTAAFQEANRALPGVSVTVECFAARLEQNAVREDDLKSRPADLLLACACAQGDRWAIEHFEYRYLSHVAAFTRNVKLDTSALEEVKQRARVKLLVGNPPGIAGYRGRAALRAWVRVSVLRLALDLAADANRSEDSHLLDAVAALQDTPELSAARHLYRERLQLALEAALERLEPRKKTILCLSAVDNLNVDAIGLIYGVHRATVARWLVAIRSEIFQSLRTDLGLKRPASSSEVRSLVELLRDQLHISVSQMLAPQS
jgi:RNA polymerase sigma-70 factor (ECF subfamily)